MTVDHRMISRSELSIIFEKFKNINKLTLENIDLPKLPPNEELINLPLTNLKSLKFINYAIDYEVRKELILKS